MPKSKCLLTRRQTLLSLLQASFGLLSGCGGGSDDSPERERRAYTISNTSDVTQSFDLEIDGRRFFANDDTVLRACIAHVDKSDPMAVALSIWKSVVQNRYHFEPMTEYRWAHSPTLFLNSLGFGICDDAASIVASLARRAGLEARVWGLNGHVVPEIRVGQRWNIFDADLQVIYLDEGGAVQGVEDLVNDLTLITTPRLTQRAQRILQTVEQDSSTVIEAQPQAYSEQVAQIYACVQDNAPEPWYDTHLRVDVGTQAFTLPPRASLLLGDPPLMRITSLHGLPVPRWATATLVLPPGCPHTVRLPLVPVAIRGTGQVKLDRETYHLGSTAIAQRLSSRAYPVLVIEPLSGNKGIEVDYLVNATRFGEGDATEVRVIGGTPSVALRERVAGRPA